MQRFIPFAEEEQRRERRSSSRASLPFMPTPPTTPVPLMYPTAVTSTSVPVREEPRSIHLLNATHVLDPEDELDLSSDEDDMLTAREGSESSNSDSWNSADSAVYISHRPIQMPPPPPSSSPQLIEEEPMDISQEDCVVVQHEPMRLGSFQGIVPKIENVQTVLHQHGNYTDSSDEEIAKVFDDDSDNESLYSWSSSSSNGRVNRPRRHADSVLDNRPYLDNNRVPSPYAHLIQSHVPAPMPHSLPQAHVPTSSPYAPPQPQVPTSLPYVHGHPQLGEVQPPLPYVHGHPQLGEIQPPLPYVHGHPQLREVRPPLPQEHPQMAMLPSTLPYVHPQVKPEINGNCAPLDLAIQSKYSLHNNAQRTPSTRINYHETQPRKMPKRPFQAPYHLEDMEMSRMEYQRQQSRSRISRRLATRFTSNERMEQDLHGAGMTNANDHFAQKSCCCCCHGTPKLLPVPVNSFAIERFLQEAQLSARASSGHATSYLLIPTHAAPAYAS